MYLNPSATFAEMQRFASEQQVILPVTEAVLWKRLDERKLLLSKEGNRLKVKRTPHGAGRTRVLHVSVSMLEKAGRVGHDE